MTKSIRIPTGFACLLLLTLLPGCSSLQETPQVSTHELQMNLRDDVFPAPDASFALEPAPRFLDLPANYQRELDRVVASLETEYERYKALRQWVFRKFDDFEFDVSGTSSLVELNNNRKINCLSFSAFFVAAARYVNVPAEFQLVFAPPYWDKHNASWINNQHINVTGVIELPPEKIYYLGGDVFSIGDIPVFNSFQGDTSSNYRYVADVNPAVVSIRLRREIIEEQQVLSFFYSNKSVEALLQGDLGVAYQYTKAALQTYPGSTLAWNNLGVLYKRAGENSLAIAAYRQAITLDDAAYSAKSNLARLYRETGATELAAALEAEVEDFRSLNPYYHAALAEEAVDAGNLELAEKYLQSALNRKHNEHHFYHQLAIVYLAQGDTEAMLENLRLARRYARGSEKTRFANKLVNLEKLLTAQ